MVTATFLRLKMEQQLIKLRLHHCSQIKKTLYCLHAQEHGCDTVRLRSFDSDVFFHIAAPCFQVRHHYFVWYWLKQHKKASDCNSHSQQ